MPKPSDNLLPLSIARAKLIRALASRKRRHAERLFVIEGARLVEEALAPGIDLQFVFGLHPQVAAAAHRRPDIPFHVTEEIDLFQTESPQGIGAVVRMNPIVGLGDVVESVRPHIFLDAITDPGNAGTIVRSAEWFGVEPVLFGSGCVDPWNAKAARASMGAILRAEIRVDVGIEELLGSGRPIVALDGGGTVDLGDAAFSRSPIGEGAIYVIGNEGKGVDRRILARADAIVRIPGSGRGESLNAAMAATLLLWELFRLH